MNRHERRQQAKYFRGLTKNDLWQVGEGGRINKENVAIKVELVRRGCVLFSNYTQPIAHFIFCITNSKFGDGPLCLTCETEFTKAELPHGFMVIGSGDPVLVNGICQRCCEQSSEELLKIGLNNVKRMWPDARELPDGGGQH
jgi:hypothetical protein